MPFEVIVKENITTKTFMNHSLVRDFYRTKANETFLADLTFTDDVIMQSDLIIQDLSDINGVTLQALKTLSKRKAISHFSVPRFVQINIHLKLQF